MRQASLYSAALHIAVITVAYLGVPSLLSTPLIKDVPITVDLVRLEDVVKTKKRPKSVKPAPPPPAKLPPQPPAALPIPPEPPEQIVARLPEPPPPLVKPKPKPKLKPKPKPKPKAKPVPKPPTKPTVKTAKVVPKPKLKPKPKPKPKPVDSMQALLKDLAKRKEELERQKNPDPKDKTAFKVPSPKPYALSAINQQMQAQKLTAMVKEQVAPCWSIPAGVEDVQEIKVAVQIRLNADGTLRGAPRVVDSNRMKKDRSFRVIAESAVRALLNPRCRPLKLPYDQYGIWKEDITFNFDPGEALGQ